MTDVEHAISLLTGDVKSEQVEEGVYKHTFTPAHFTMEEAAEVLAQLPARYNPELLRLMGREPFTFVKKRWYGCHCELCPPASRKLRKCQMRKRQHQWKRERKRYAR